MRLVRRKGGPVPGDLKRRRPGDDRWNVPGETAGRDGPPRPRAGREEVRMAIPAGAGTGAVVRLDSKRRRRRDLLARLREIDHWRRLVAARLDLAVAAVTSIDEPEGECGDAPSAAGPPAGLKEILGLPACDQALPEASVLLRLRAAQRDLDEYARALRASADLAATDLAATDLAAPPDAGRAGQRPGRRSRSLRSVTHSHLRVVPQPGPGQLPPPGAGSGPDGDPRRTS
ncbi:MAG TPA: hypothetical protein VI248_09505 [Kineosporiaceae bacterium]